MISGTASNAFALSLMTNKNDYVICHKDAIFLQVSVVHHNSSILGLNY